MSNTMRTVFAMLSAFMFICWASGWTGLLWIPIIGTAVAAATGTCHGTIVAEMILDKLGIPR